ncbi:MAG: hypothetical protein HFJ50_06755 [Clostridia bacterium]|nr:hypothetical protein [Clostridia bacterium]
MQQVMLRQMEEQEELDMHIRMIIEMDTQMVEAEVPEILVAQAKQQEETISQ